MSEVDGSLLMSDGDALLRAVIAAPDEDTPRLVYADWLDEQNQSMRAAVIRDQIEAELAESFSLHARTAADRANARLLQYGDQWTSHLPSEVEAVFLRGFVGHLDLHPSDFVRHVTELFAAEPVQSLRFLRFLPEQLDRVFTAPQLQQIRRLAFAPMSRLTPEEFTLLSSCTQLSGLRDLSLPENPVPPQWLSGVLEGSTFPELAGLNLANNPHLGPSLAAALPRANHRDIRELDVGNVLFTSQQLRDVLQSRCLRRVERLHLTNLAASRNAGPLAFLDLGWAIPWQQLVLLDLANQRVGDEGVRELVRLQETAKLRWLGLSQNALSKEAVRLLVETRHLRLNHLDLKGNGFGGWEHATLQSRFPDAVIEV